MSKPIPRRGRLVALFAALAVTAAAAPAFADLAQSRVVVDAAKSRGAVGEQGDGYLGIVMDGDEAIRAAVAEINAGRAAAYREAAAKTGATPEAAGQAAARQLMARLPPGQYFKPLGGGWMRK
jgi:uncharacterized protein YdbL (DUF1318 family)